ncbi:MAG: cytochrome c3 family protein [bacterium]
MRSKKIILIIVPWLILWACSSTLALDGGAGHRKGAHNQGVVGLKRLVCTYCHFSQPKKGEVIWAEPPKGAQTLPMAEGVITVCCSCHYPGNAVNALSGFTLGRHEAGRHDFLNGNVLCDTSLLGIGQNHVMSEQVELDPQAGKLAEPLDSFFPLKPLDGQDTASQDKTAKGAGFTCITCHDPHNQPHKDISGHGDYLRSREEGLAGTSDNRTPFCTQCHKPHGQESVPPDAQAGAPIACHECHHPHDGFYQINTCDGLGRAILTQRITPTHFQALPNVAVFDPPPKGKGIDHDTSSLCYSCHGTKAPDRIRQIGARPIHGDDSESPCEHHPMGTQAQSGASARAPGLAGAVLNEQGQVTCISCHHGFHRGKNLHFLREDFTADQSSLCTSCHLDKKAVDLGRPGEAHSQIAGQSPNQRGECMFCHFIHDGPERGNQMKPFINALLRVDPVNLTWSDQADGTGTDDFEDLCFGCHSSEVYMKGQGREGAGLQPGKYFSHRFSSIPSSSIYALLPVSDGSSEKVIDDYGVPEGEIYCGSCHNPHQSANKPYLRGEDSPYEGSGFCAQCHTLFPAGGRSTHPTGRPPQTGITVTQFPEEFFGGKSGIPRGITSDESSTGKILCLTCHSIHAAKTSFQGCLDLSGAKDENPGKHGKLLVLDNSSTPEGSDLCRSCHVPNRNIAGSRHDFSDLGPSPSLSSGVCSSCHVPHGSPEETVLWARSLDEEREGFSQKDNPDYQKGVTLLCYDCHDDHYSVDDDPPLSLFLFPPQDIAFTDGPGKNSTVGFYETIPPGSISENGVNDPPVNGTETGGHYLKTTGLRDIINGISTGDKLPCNTCHNPHQVSSNEVFLCLPPGVNSPNNLTASKKSRNGSGDGRKVCASCHGYSESHRRINTPAFLFGIDILKTPSQEQIPLEAHQESAYGMPCTDCHLHNRMAVPKSQRSGPETHAFHFKGLLTEGEESVIPSRKLYVSDNPERKCDFCHPSDLLFRDGRLVFHDGKTFDQTTVCDTCHSRQGFYDGVNGRYQAIISQDHGAKDCWKEGVYREVMNESGAIETGFRPGKEAWCIGCHDDEPSRLSNPDLPEQSWVKAPNIAGDKSGTYGFYLSGHGLPGQYSYQLSGRSGAGLLCTDCHSLSKPHIVNDQRGKTNNQTWQANGYRLKLTMVLPRRSEQYHSSDFNLCFSCHEEASIIGLPPGYRDYTNNHNPYVNLDVDEFAVTRFSNADPAGVYPLRTMGRGIKIDFNVLFPNSSYNIHWNHLALPNAVLPEEAVISPQTQQQNQDNSGIQRTQTCYSSRCHGGTGIVKARSNSFWDSDRDGVLDSRPSCTACHNPHGSRYIFMTRNDLAIEHISDPDGEYGSIGSREYGAYTASLDNYNDLYCGECHAQLQRMGNSVIYYPQPTVRDRLSPAPPL